MGGGGPKCDGGGVGDGEPYSDGGDMGGGVSYLDVGDVGGGVQGEPTPGSGVAGGAFEVGPLSSTIQKPSDVQQRAAGQVAHPRRGTFDVFRHVAGSFYWWWSCDANKAWYKYPLIGDCAASIHCAGDGTRFYNKRPQPPMRSFRL